MTLTRFSVPLIPNTHAGPLASGVAGNLALSEFSSHHVNAREVQLYSFTILDLGMSNPICSNAESRVCVRRRALHGE